MILFTLLAIEASSGISWLAVRDTAYASFNHEVFRDNGALTSAFVACVINNATHRCYEGNDPDCLSLSGMKTFANQQSTQLSGMDWSKNDLARLYLHGERLYFILPWAMATLRWLDDIESNMAHSLTYRESVRHLYRLGIMNKLPPGLMEACLFEASLIQDHVNSEKIKYVPPPPPPPLPPPPLPPQLECTALYPDYEKCKTMDAITQLKKCKQGERRCRPLPQTKEYECTCPI